jgi:hypothetical protein
VQKGFLSKPQGLIVLGPFDKIPSMVLDLSRPVVGESLPL